MTFFESFPSKQVTYTIKTDSTPIVATIQDLTTSVGMVITPTDLNIMCFKYTIKNSDLPQTLSQQFYNSPEFDWTILYINGIFNLNTDWPLKELQLREFVSDKYGVSNIDAANCYLKVPENVIMDHSFIVSNYGAQYAVALSNYDWEEFLNEQKRYIYCLKPENVSDFVLKFTTALNS